MKIRSFTVEKKLFDFEQMACVSSSVYFTALVVWRAPKGFDDKTKTYTLHNNFVRCTFM